jgi:hypothetical protein
MTKRIVVATLVAALASWSTVTVAQTKSTDCPQPSASPGAAGAAKAPARIEGQVTNIDRKSNMVTMRLSDGSTQQFRGNDETIADLKVGDRIEAKKRTPDC